jgi:hypothetical protein
MNTSHPEQRIILVRGRTSFPLAATPSASLATDPALIGKASSEKTYFSMLEMAVRLV